MALGSVFELVSMRAYSHNMLLIVDEVKVSSLQRLLMLSVCTLLLLCRPVDGNGKTDKVHTDELTTNFVMTAFSEDDEFK